MRPRTLEQFVGQAHLLAQGSALRTAIEQGTAPLDGPLRAARRRQDDARADGRREHRSAAFEELSAVQAGRAEVRAVIERAEHRRASGGANARRCSSSMRSTASTRPSRTRCCRPSRTGSLTLIGATTENPAFEVNGALLSRLRVYALQALSAEEVGMVLRARRRRRRAGRRGRARVPRGAQRRRRAHGAERARAGARHGRASSASRASRSRAPRTRCSGGPCSTTKAATATTTTSRPGSRPRAAPIPTPRSTTSR